MWSGAALDAWRAVRGGTQAAPSCRSSARADSRPPPLVINLFTPRLTSSSLTSHSSRWSSHGTRWPQAASRVSGLTAGLKGPTASR